MSVRDEIKGLIYMSGHSLSDVVDQMPRNSLQNLSQKLSRGTLKYSEFREILEIIGFKMKFKKK